MSVCPMEELLLDDPLASTGPDVEKNTINQGEMVATRAVPPYVTNEDDLEAIMVDEEPNKCYTCHIWMVNGSPGAALVVHVQQNKASKLTLKVCHACCRSLDYDLTTGDIYQELNGCPILPESKIIVNYSNLSHKCFRCFTPLLSPSLHPVSLQDGILNTSHTAVLQDSGYEFAVYLCNSCAEWKKFSGKMKEVTTLKFPAFDLTKRTLFLPPISNIQPSNSSQAGTRSITYPVSMLVNKAKSLIERFKAEASLSSPPTNITGCMMYIHTTKSSPSTHWSCDGFAFHKSSTRVVRIQNSDHVIRETNWVTAGPGDSGTRFKRRTITSSQLEDFTLVHYLGEVCTGVQASREVDLDEEQPNISSHVSPQSCKKGTLANKGDKRKVKIPSPLFSNYPALNIEATPATLEPDKVIVPAPVVPDNPSSSSTDSAVSEDPLLPTIVSVSGSVGGITVMGSSPPLPLLEGPILHSQIAAQYSNSLVNKSIKKIISPVQTHKTLNVSIPGQEVLRPVLPTKPIPFNPGQKAPRPVQLTPQLSVNTGNQVTPTPNPVLLTKPPQVKPDQSFQGLASKIIVSGNKIIVPHNFMASGARLVQVPSGDGTKRLVLINTSQVVTTSKNTAAKKISSVPSIPPNSSQVMTTSMNKVTKTIGVVPSIPANTPQVVTTSKNTTTKTVSVITSIPSIPKKEKLTVNLLPSSRSPLDTLSTTTVPEEPETAVDPLETDSSRNPPANASASQKSISQTRINHLERLSAVQANICAEIAEECIFNKSFSDVLIYGATSSEQKNPLRTHSLILSAISPNLRQLLEISERNGDGVYELVIPGVALQEIEALVEEVIGTMLMPPKDDKSVTFTMSENLWTLFAGVRPEEAKLGKSYIHSKPVVPNSFSARLKPMESLTGHWAKQSVCDEQTGQMVIEMGRKRKMVNTEEQSMAKNIKTSADMSSGGIKLSDWRKQVGLSGQSNIQEKEPCVKSLMVHSDNLLKRYYHIYRDKLPVKTVSVNIMNLHRSDSNTVVYLDNYKKPENDDKVLPPCDGGSVVEDDLDLLPNEDIFMVPPVKIRTSSNITGSMGKKKSPEKWIVSQ